MALIPFISACSAHLDDYRGESPELDLSQFFNGHLEAYGIVQDHKGKVSRRFKADILGRWQGDQGVLDELFSFSDGEEQHRCWQLHKQGRFYQGRAGDVVGVADGEVSGNALNWQYTLAIPVNGKTWNIKLNDWMFLVDENNLINRASMKKFGLEVGEITLYIRKVSDQPHRELTPGCLISEVEHG
ncbi:MAG: DUF3833 domain-containing protein [Neptuniibacter sp.]